MDVPGMETIGDRIRRLRLARQLTQQQLADVESLRVQRNLINYWENDERDIKSGQIIALADFFCVTCDYLLRGAEAEHADIHKKTGLRESAIQWFNEKKEKTPLYTEAFNLLFEHEDNGIVLASVLANAIVRFCMAKYTTFTEQNYALGLAPGEPMVEEQTYEFSRVLLLAIGEKRFARVLERLGEKWECGVDEIMKLHMKTAEAILKAEIMEGDEQDAEETRKQ